MDRHRSLISAAVLTCLLLAVAGAAAASGPALPAGTVIYVRMIDSLTSENARAGQVFHGTLEQPIEAGGKALYPRGADVTGKITRVHPSGRLSDPGELELVLTSLSHGPTATPLYVQPFAIKGQSHKKSNITKIGGGTALGALIGGLAGGGKGAAIGAGVGAAGGTGVAAATGKKEASVEAEAVLAWTTVAPPVPPAPAAAPAPPAAAQSFSLRDQRVIRTCLSDTSNLPPGLAKREQLPPGLEGQLQRKGTLPPGLQNKVQSLPLSCVNQLPPLPANLDRVVYGNRVMLIDSANHILDAFDLNQPVQQ